MIGGKKVSWNQVYEKFGKTAADFDREQLTEEQHKEFIECCYNEYETEVSDIFWTPYEQYNDRIGQKFSITGRVTDKENDACVLPMWHIRFEDGYETLAWPEEIIISEINANKH